MAGTNLKNLKVCLFGSTGMVGQGVLRECLASPQVERVLSVTRRLTDTPPHPKLTELVHKDFSDFNPIAQDLKSCHACFWCLGVSSGGMSEADYTRVTFDYTMAAAKAMAHPGMTFVYVSGAGTDSTEKGSVMWARVKGRVENQLQTLGFKAAYAFRPGVIEPLDGIESHTKAYRLTYKVLSPLFPLAKLVAGRHISSTQSMGRAMLQAALQGAPQVVNHNPEINALAEAYTAAQVPQ